MSGNHSVAREGTAGHKHGLRRETYGAATSCRLSSSFFLTISLGEGQYNATNIIE